jgi:hypothetical protein
MKRTAFFIFASILFVSQASAQYGSRNRRSDESPGHAFTVGVAPFSLLLRSGKINLRGEWAYADNKSLSLLVAVPRPTKIPGFLLDDLDATEGGNTTKNRFTQFGLTLENRFYLGHRAPRGFYLAPYLRYNQFGITHAKTSEEQYDTKIKGVIGGAGLGGAMGAQFRMGDHMTMDITFVGIDFKWMRGTLTYSSNDPENDVVAFRNEVQNTVEDIPIIGKKLSAQIEGDEIKVRAPLGVWPAYRFNLTVNYAF